MGVPKAKWSEDEGDGRGPAWVAGRTGFFDAGYSACGLGSDGTDRLVALVREGGAGHGLYGAEITGGGSGGTVSLLVERGKHGTVGLIADRDGRESGHGSAVYVGSSDGSRAFGVRTLNWLRSQLSNGGHS